MPMLCSPVEASRQRVNPLLNSYTDYEDSVYGLAWSSREPWIFASLSYDGRVSDFAFDNNLKNYGELRNRRFITPNNSKF
jgi:WD40 repeat protein